MDRCSFQLPVLPIVVYLKVGLDRVGTDASVESLGNLEVNRFQYLYVGLPGLDGVQYVEGDNWLGVALSALMRIPRERIVWLGAEALRRIAGAPLNDQQRFLLGECVQAYLTLNEEQTRQFESLLDNDEYAEVNAMNQTVYEKGIEKGRREELLDLVCIYYEEYFGPVPTHTREQLEQSSMNDLRQLALRIPKAASPEEVGLPNLS